MELRKKEGRFYFPENSMKIKFGKDSLERVTHLGIGAHQDDLEVMASHGIAECFKKEDLWFGGITCTNGAGSARGGKFSKYTDEDMMKVRHDEQEVAADHGEYSFVAQLGYSSDEIKGELNKNLLGDLTALFKACKPRYVYTHNLFDKHTTHVAVAITVLEALEHLHPDDWPEKVYGCEVWRDLDWLADEDKVPLDLTGKEELVSSLIQVFESQISGGKRYDLATLGRMRANATYFDSYSTDKYESLWYAVDMAPLVRGEIDSVETFVKAHLDNFSSSVLNNVKY